MNSIIDIINMHEYEIYFTFNEAVAQNSDKPVLKQVVAQAFNISVDWEDTYYNDEGFLEGCVKILNDEPSALNQLMHANSMVFAALGNRQTEKHMIFMCRKF